MLYKVLLGAFIGFSGTGDLISAISRGVAEAYAPPPGLLFGKDVYIDLPDSIHVQQQQSQEQHFQSYLGTGGSLRLEASAEPYGYYGEQMFWNELSRSETLTRSIRHSLREHRQSAGNPDESVHVVEQGDVLIAYSTYAARDSSGGFQLFANSANAGRYNCVTEAYVVTPKTVLSLTAGSSRCSGSEHGALLSALRTSQARVLFD